jgi:hypothetical protein
MRIAEGFGQDLPDFYETHQFSLTRIILQIV